jgi:hypothetical protein
MHKYSWIVTDRDNFTRGYHMNNLEKYHINKIYQQSSHLKDIFSGYKYPLYVVIISLSDTHSQSR